MTRGRKPQPSPTRTLRGNPSKRGRNHAEPQFEAAAPPPPEFLDAAALLEWDRLTAELAARQVITQVDMAILAIYCHTWSELQDLVMQSKTEQRYLDTETGYKYKNPIFADIAKLRKELQTYSAELGITPSSRSRIKTVAKPGQADPNDKAARLRAAFGAIPTRTK